MCNVIFLGAYVAIDAFVIMFLPQESRSQNTSALSKRASSTRQSNNHVCDATFLSCFFRLSPLIRSAFYNVQHSLFTATYLYNAPAMSTILSLHGKSLKLDTREDIAPYLADVDPAILEEIHFGGNTIGVEASEALAEFLKKAVSLKVRLRPAHLTESFTRDATRFLGCRLRRHLYRTSHLGDSTVSLPDL